MALDRLATFIHGEWGDVLFHSDDEVCGRFYRAVAGLTGDWTAQVLPTAPRVCEVGGGLGRFAFELAARSLGRDELVLVEPDATLCTWARRLLCGEPFDGSVPVVTGSEVTGLRAVPPERMPVPAGPVTVRTATAAGLGAPDGHFDLVTCLNVVDRVAVPADLVAELCRLVRPGGVLVLASPFHFRDELTARERRITDLRQVLAGGQWSVVGEASRVPYEFRFYDRGLIRYTSQVVAAVRR
jgi:SAM-dependent methyltransferase